MAAKDKLMNIISRRPQFPASDFSAKTGSLYGRIPANISTMSSSNLYFVGILLVMSMVLLPTRCVDLTTPTSQDQEGQSQQIQPNFHNHHHHHHQHSQQGKPTKPCPSLCTCWGGPDTAITTVDCSSRDLHSIPPLPSSALVVYLQNNSIEKVQCNDFIALNNLTELNLSQNRMTRLENCTFDSQRKLTRLNMSGGALTHIDLQAFRPLKNLVYLDISRNGITEIQPILFSQMSKLEYLNIYFNELSHLGNDSFFGLRSLRQLSLQRNQLRYINRTFEEGAFRGLDALERLDIRENQPDSGQQVTYPDIALSFLTKLRHLSMDGYPAKLGLGFRSLNRLTVLDLSMNAGTIGSFCSMNSDLPEDFLGNIMSKEPLFLNMANCGITRIPSEFFTPVPNIYSLDLSSNMLHFDTFETGSKGLANSNLTYLNLLQNYVSKDETYEIKNSTFRYLKHTRLKTLILAHNRVYRIDPKAILDLPSSLEYLCLAHNALQSGTFLSPLIFLTNMKVIDARFQLFDTDSWRSSKDESQKQHASGQGDFQCKIRHETRPIGFSDNQRVEDNEKRLAFNNPVLPPVIKEQGIKKLLIPEEDGLLNASDVRCPKPQEFLTSTAFLNPFFSVGFSEENIVPLPRDLEVIYASNAKLNYPIPPMHFINNNVLRYLDYSSNLARCWQGPLKGLPALQYLDLSNNACTQMGLHFFKYLTNLTTLLLNDNDLGQPLADDVNGIAFSTLTNLKTLDLSRNAIKDLAETTFLHNVRLQLISLRGNDLSRFDPFLKQLHNMTHLDLSSNILEGLSEENCLDFKLLKTRNEHFTVNIRDNRFLCSCEFRPFLKLLVHSPNIFKDVQTFHCTLANRSVLRYEHLERFFPELERQCQAEAIFIFVVITFFIVLGSASVLSVFYFYRWKLTYLYYIGQRRLRIGATHVTYMPLAQLFFIYDQEDLHWRRFLQREFLPRLRREGITYILGEVDFQGGHRFPQVAGAIVGTKKSLVLLSKDIFEDGDRQTEINLAIMHELNTGSDVIVPVWVERVDMTSYPLEVSTFLQNQYHRCLVYENTDRFWTVLVSVLRATD